MIATEKPKDSVYSLLRKNSNILYSDTIEDKEIIYVYLNERIASAIELSPVAIGTKNLIYFSVFGSDDYVAMLEHCLKSIAALSDRSKFDLMVITDTLTKAKIEALSVVSVFPAFDYFIVDTPNTGVDASIQKIRIFEYPNISQYSKILFLDCDMLVPSAIEPVFAAEIDSALIEVASSNAAQLINTDLPTWRSLFHILDYFSQDNKAYLIANPDKCHPFNAGQFLFVNSLQMKKHFENVQWLMKVWPGEYYFEQSFMNHYFVLNGFTSWQVLNTKTAFINITLAELAKTQTITKTITHITLNKPKNYKNHSCAEVTALTSKTRSETVKQVIKRVTNLRELDILGNISDYYLVHFIGNSTNGEAKLKYINQFMIDKNICQ